MRSPNSFCEICDTWTKPDGPYSQCPVCALRTEPPTRFAFRNEAGRLLSTDRFGDVIEVLSLSEAFTCDTREQITKNLSDFPWREHTGWLEIVEFAYPAYRPEDDS